MSKNKDMFVKVCPKCKSTNVTVDKSTLQQVGVFPTLYICNNCNHSAYTFPEIKLSKLENFENAVDKNKLRDLKGKKTELIDTYYSDFQVQFIWKLSAIFIILIGLIFIFNNLLVGTVLILLGLIIFLITYFKKRNLKNN